VSADEDELLLNANIEFGALFGAQRGAELVARRMRKNVLEVDLDVSMTPDAAAKRVEEVLADEGALIRAGPGAEDAPYEVVGLVTAGLWNLTPAVVTVTIRPSDYGSRLVIRGAAKEPLIKQRVGEAAARRVATALTDHR